MRATQGSGKGRWVVGIFALALLLAFGLFLYWLGRPIEAKMIEVDVTDKIAESAAQ